MTATEAQRRGWTGRLHELARLAGLVAERTAAALIMAAPGAALAGLYGRRLMALRADPSGSTGTPAETWLALMVAFVAALAARFAWTAARGALPRPVGAALVMGLAMAALVIGSEVV